MNYPIFASNNQDKIISMAVDDDSFVKVRATVLGGEQDVANITELIQFKEVTNIIEKIAESTTATFNKVKPDKASVEFGIEIAIEAGVATALIVKGSGTGNLKITLEWGKDK